MKAILDFQRDTFSFANETRWQYGVDAETGRQIAIARARTPDYTLRCYVVARSAKQFWQHARFEGGRPASDEQAYRRLIRDIVSRNVRKPSTPRERVVVPGYSCLREFSTAHEKLLKAECGGVWRSYLQRGNWRMLLPFPRRLQASEARRLFGILTGGILAVVHVSRFPQLNINHALLLFGVSKKTGALIFHAYDPNIPEREIQLEFDCASRTFTLPPLHYFVGGRVDAYEIYRGWIY